MLVSIWQNWGWTPQWVWLFILAFFKSYLYVCSCPKGSFSFDLRGIARFQVYWSEGIKHQRFKFLLFLRRCCCCWVSIEFQHNCCHPDTEASGFTSLSFFGAMCPPEGSPHPNNSIKRKVLSTPFSDHFESSLFEKKGWHLWCFVLSASNMPAI